MRLMGIEGFGKCKPPKIGLGSHRMLVMPCSRRVAARGDLYENPRTVTKHGSVDSLSHLPEAPVSLNP